MDLYNRIVLTTIAISTIVLALQSLGVGVERVVAPRSAVAASRCGDSYSPCIIPGLSFRFADGFQPQVAQPVYVVNAP